MALRAPRASEGVRRAGRPPPDQSPVPSSLGPGKPVCTPSLSLLICDVGTALSSRAVYCESSPRKRMHSLGPAEEVPSGRGELKASALLADTKGGGGWEGRRSGGAGAASARSLGEGPAASAPGTRPRGQSCVPGRAPGPPSPAPRPAPPSRPRAYSGSAGALGGLGAAGGVAWSGGSWGGGWRGLRPVGRGGLRA